MSSDPVCVFHYSCCLTEGWCFSQWFLCLFNLFTAMFAVPSLRKRPIKMPNFIPLMFFCLLRMNTWKVSIKTHSIENRFVTGPLNILFSRVHVCIFEPEKITGWGSEGVNIWLFLLNAHVLVCVCVCVCERGRESSWTGLVWLIHIVKILVPSKKIQCKPIFVVAYVVWLTYYQDQNPTSLTE